MVERRRGFGFDLESLAFFGIGSDLAGEELDGDRAFQLGILGFVNHAHAALTKFFENLVVENCLTNHCGSPTFFNSA